MVKSNQATVELVVVQTVLRQILDALAILHGAGMVRAGGGWRSCVRARAPTRANKQTPLVTANRLGLWNFHGSDVGGSLCVCFKWETGKIDTEDSAVKDSWWEFRLFFDIAVEMSTSCSRRGKVENIHVNKSNAGCETALLGRVGMSASWALMTSTMSIEVITADDVELSVSTSLDASMRGCA